MERHIGVELKDLLFGVDGIPTSSIPKYLNVTAPTFPHKPSSQGKQSKGVIVSGKRKKKGMQQGKSFPKKRTIHPQPGIGKQVQQAMPLAKRQRTDEGWRGAGDGIAAPNHGGWDEMRGGRGGGWEGNGAAGGGWEVRGGSSGGWGDWGGGGGGWGAGIQQQHSGWGSWGGGVQQQQSSWGWGRGGDHQQQQQNSRSWPPPPPLQQQSSGGWEGARQQNLRGWGWGEGAHQGSNLL